MLIHKFDSVDILLESLADLVVAKADEAIKLRGRFSFVLSGGSSPKRLYELLSSDRYKKQVDWTKVFFFFGDERNVPMHDPQSNFLMVKKALFDPLGILDSHIFPMDTSLTPKAAAAAYQTEIDVFFTHEALHFDFILLGLGDNSHTASLFPYSPILNEKSPIIKEDFVGEVDMYRITFTAPLINQARAIAFLVYGPSKAEAVKHILRDEVNVEKFPAQLIKPVNGELHWFLDVAAARMLAIGS